MVGWKFTNIIPLDVTKCENLEYFDCARIKGITELDLSQAHHLKNVIVTDCSLGTLSIPQDAPITELLCAGNKLTSIDLSLLNKLVDLDVSKNDIDQISVKSDSLKSLYAMNTKIKEIDLSHVPNVEYVMLTGNSNLTAVDFSNNKEITDLGLSSCALTKLDVTMLPKLMKLWCNSNKIETLNLVNCKKISILKAGTNALKSVEFPDMPDSLTIVSLPNNQFTAINIYNLARVISLDLGGNQLSSVDLSGMEALEVLNLRGNSIHAIDLSLNTRLKTLGIVGNGMTACELNDIYRQLPMLASKPKALNLYNGTASDESAKTSDTSLAEARNWKPAVLGDGTGCNSSVDEIFSEEDMFVWKKGETVHVLSPYAPSLITIYNIDGKIIDQRTLAEHNATFRLPQNGIYVVNCKDTKTGKSKTERIRF